MARMHTRRKGKSRSTRPYRTSAPTWSNINADEIDRVVVELREQDKSTSEIGMILRDRYGIPDVKLATGKKITQILEDNDLKPKIPEDLRNLIAKVVRLHKHLEKNKKDVHNKRSLQLTESKIRRLVKYYKRTKVLPETWKYSIDTAEMLISR